MIAKRL